ncbi:hypothetical protein BKI52_40590 [marine bacterium AO1-C]|nr:hypothetical protein BKI52_40590 [marine bacterium AO1-C]
MTCSDDSKSKQKLFYVIVLFILLLITSVVSAQTNSLKNDEEEKIFYVVYKPQTPPGGRTAFLRYIQREVEYPTQARRMGIEGTVIIRFRVDSYGEIIPSGIIKSLHPTCDQAVIRVLKNAPRWLPGQARGKPRGLYANVAVAFKID